jgi:hypothetical protein
MARLADRTSAERTTNLDEVEPYEVNDGRYDDQSEERRRSQHSDGYVAD